MRSVLTDNLNLKYRAHSGPRSQLFRLPQRSSRQISDPSRVRCSIHALVCTHSHKHYTYMSRRWPALAHATSTRTPPSLRSASVRNVSPDCVPCHLGQNIEAAFEVPAARTRCAANLERPVHESASSSRATCCATACVTHGGALSSYTEPRESRSGGGSRRTGRFHVGAVTGSGSGERTHPLCMPLSTVGPG
ncbi:hypothetical protein MTO96_011897 [Rhipicephalus appendiculatus]